MKKNFSVLPKEKRLAICPERPYFYDHLSVEETLDFFSSLYGLTRSDRKKCIKETLEIVGLGERAKHSIRSLSKGLQQRLGFAQAIVHQPKLLLLDEPFSGLDPVGRAQMRELISSLKEQGTTIFLSSHVLSDVENICNRVSIMADGELKDVFSLDNLSSRASAKYELVIETENEFEEVPEEIIFMSNEYKTEKTSQGFFHNMQFASYAKASQALTLAASRQLTIRHFEKQVPSLEEVFISVVNQAKEA